MSFIFSRRALRELDNAVAYIAERDIDAARQLRERVRQAAATFAEAPDMGEVYLGKLRKWNVWPYVMIYLKQRGAIVIVRFHHGRQKWRA